MITGSTALIDRFEWMIVWFCNQLAAEAHRRRVQGPLGIAAWNALRRAWKRFSALYAKWKAGTLPAPRVRRRTSPRPSGSSPGASLPHSGEAEVPQAAGRPRVPNVLRTFNWFRKLLPETAAALSGTLQDLLFNVPEMKAFVGAAPQAGRILRPMCWMVGIRPPEYLQLPMRKRVRKKKDPPPPHPLAARFPDTPAARAAARALAREQAGLPVDVSKLSAVAYGYCIHPPRDDKCPPPEIGYGGRTWRPPKDYRPPKNEE